jgi:hypothetical protein
MLALQTVCSELVLHVNERASFRRRTQPRLGHRAIGRRLAVVAARLERSIDFQSSLRRVLEADEAFQQTLDGAQRTSWLTLEDALFDHAWRSNRAFFRAGLEMGWRAAASGGVSAGKPAPHEQRHPSKARRARARHAKHTGGDTELILSLLDIIRRLVDR